MRVEKWYSVIFQIINTLKVLLLFKVLILKVLLLKVLLLKVQYYLVAEKQIVKFGKEERWPASTESMTDLTQVCRAVAADDDALGKSEEILMGPKAAEWQGNKSYKKYLDLDKFLLWNVC